RLRCGAENDARSRGACPCASGRAPRRPARRPSAVSRGKALLLSRGHRTGRSRRRNSSRASIRFQQLPDESGRALQPNPLLDQLAEKLRSGPIDEGHGRDFEGQTAMPGKFLARDLAERGDPGAHEPAFELQGGPVPSRFEPRNLEHRCLFSPPLEASGIPGLPEDTRFRNSLKKSDFNRRAAPADRDLSPQISWELRNFVGGAALEAEALDAAAKGIRVEAEDARRPTGSFDNAPGGLEGRPYVRTLDLLEGLPGIRLGSQG